MLVDVADSQADRLFVSVVPFLLGALVSSVLFCLFALAGSIAGVLNEE